MAQEKIIKPIEVNDENFEKEVIEKSENIPVVVDFWAEWCMPCQKLKPMLEKIEEEYKGRFVLAKINIDNGKEMAEKYGVMSIPSVKMFKKGNVTAEFTGSLPEPSVRKWIEKNL